MADDQRPNVPSLFAGMLLTKEDFSRKEINEFKDVFRTYDRNRDNQMCVDELGKALKDLDIEASKREIEAMLKKADKDHSRHLDFDEFFELIVSKITSDDLHKEFKRYDENGDNFITRGELKRGLKKISEHLTDEDINRILKEADTDKDGKINYKEFIRMVSF